DAHLAAGVPAHKLVLGVPFYGRGNKEFRQSESYSRMPALPDGFAEKWDEVAQASYLANEKGEFVFGYETPRSLAVKCAYAKEKGLKGIMFWEYAGDTSDNILCRVIGEYFKAQ
ncbi:MAG: glycosyl hydrolase family 18, partial [Bacteroidales bacterium]|nr:glycosyl hydrolase family 18 [Bacteroidales bacterium]